MAGWLGNLGKVSERFKEQAASFAPIAEKLTSQASDVWNHALPQLAHGWCTAGPRLATWLGTPRVLMCYNALCPIATHKRNRGL